MAKRVLTASESFELRQALHIAAIDALMSARRWQPGQLVFQGGTSLHLAHGSPRFSEDLDFLVDSTLPLGSLAQSVNDRLAGTRWIPDGTRIKVMPAKDGRNPHAFVVAIVGDDLLGSVRVKVELWQTDPNAISAVHVHVATVGVARGPMSGVQAFVPAADLHEIYADKVFALAARSFLKPRDVFDLHWLETHAGIEECESDSLRVRLATYPNTTANEWIEKAKSRLEMLPGSVALIASDLARWLPSSWPLSEAHVAAMTATAARALNQGIEVMSTIVAEHEPTTPGPSP